MPYDPENHHRCSIRKQGFDYTQAGAYFVTICTQNREPILHDPVIVGILKDVWQALPNWFPEVALDEFVIMPNHTHFVVWLSIYSEFGDGNSVASSVALTPPVDPWIQVFEEQAQSFDLQCKSDWRVPPSVKTNDNPRLGDVVGAWKSLVTNVYLDWIKRHDPTLRAKFWQRNYYERIVRNDRALTAFRQYIRDNPKNWVDDPDNPSNRLQLPFPETMDDYLDDIRIFVNRTQS
ncbi:MAG: transposase [Caldilineaceae bacterium]